MTASDNSFISIAPPRTWIVIALVVFSVFSGSLNNDFVDWDDPYFIKYNPMIQSLTPNNLWEMATSLQKGNWHPLTWLSHAVDFHFFQFNPAGHRFTSIILHSLNAVWVFLLFTRLVGKTAPGLQSEQSLIMGGIIASLLFGIHPLRVESAVWISERKDLLCAFFVMATYWAYLSYVFAADKKKRARSYLAALFLLLLALLSKPMAITVPVTLLLLDAFPLKRWQNLADALPLALEKLPFFSLSLVSGMLTLIAQKQEGAVVSMTALDMTDRLLNAAESVLFYIGKTVWPARLVPLYPLQKNASLANGGLFLAATALITIVCIQMWRNHRPALPTTWFYYLITIFPVIGIIQAGSQSAADRYSYLPTLGFYFLIGISVSWLWEKNSSSVIPDAVRRDTVLLVSIIALFSLGYLTIQQTKIWKNSETLWSYVVKSFPAQSAIAEYSMGLVYGQKGLLKEEEEQYNIALSIDPTYVQALNGLGRIYYEKGLYEKAEMKYKLALTLHPDTGIHNNLGALYLKTGRVVEAKTQFLAALRLNQNNTGAHINLGHLYNSLGQLEEAAEKYKTALETDPADVNTRNELGMVYYMSGLYEKAETEYKLSLKIRPDSGIHNNLGMVYLKMARVNEAKTEFLAALSLNPNNVEARNNLELLLNYLNKPQL